MRFLLLACAIVACAPAMSDVVKTPHFQGLGEISGQVLDAKTGKPIDDAYLVALRREPAESTSGSLSGGGGNFDFDNLKPAVYEVMVEKNGYKTATAGDLLVRPNEKVVVRVLLHPGDPSSGDRLDGHYISPPVLLHKGVDPAYSVKAWSAGVQGQLLIKCMITAAGDVRNCRMRKTLPYMDDDAIIAALQSRKYKPAARDGKPIDVDYTFRIIMSLPR
jgi:hypothetical protein